MRCPAHQCSEPRPAPVECRYIGTAVPYGTNLEVRQIWYRVRSIIPFGDAVEACGPLAVVGDLRAHCASSNGIGLGHLSGFLVVDAVWLWYSRMSFARANLDGIIRLVLF